jgi:hypothetical protein
MTYGRHAREVRSRDDGKTKNGGKKVFHDRS